MPLSKDSPWKAFALNLFGIYIAGFAAYNLYEWYATGQMYLHAFSEYTSPQWNSFAAEPVRFSLMAAVYVGAFLLFGVGALVRLVSWFRQGYRSSRRRK
jgi:hypothetical protein